MRTREEVLAGFGMDNRADFIPVEARILEVLLDIRELLLANPKDHE